MPFLGQYALPWGVETPQPVDAGRYGITLLDLEVGDPVAYVQVLRTKGYRAVLHGFHLPDQRVE